MGFPPADKSLAGVLRDTRERLDLVERRLAVASLAATLGPSQSGVLVGSYSGSGPASVRLPGGPDGPPATVQASWATTYVPNLSRSVSVASSGDGWVILGQTDMNSDGSGFYALTLASNWSSYNRILLDRNWNSRIGATRLPTGLVVLTGLARSIGTPAEGSLIGTLPPECRPEHEVLLSVEAGDVGRAIHIHPTTGAVTCIGGGWAADQYLNLDGVAFWAADSEATGNWVEVGQGGSSWGANFEANPAWANYGVPAFYKDRYGMTWFRGLARIKTAVSLDNTNIVTLPASARAHLEHHVRGTGSHFGYSGFGARPTDGLNWKSGGGTVTAVGSYLSLTGPVLVTPDALTLNTWARPPLLNGWVNYAGGQFTPFGFTRRGDGLVKFQGLISTGNTAAAISTLASYPEMWPRAHRIILGIMANQVRARLDVQGHDEDGVGRAPLEVFPANGASANWTSLDSALYVP